MSRHRRLRKTLRSPQREARTWRGRQLGVIAQALGDAISYRAPDTCRDCAQGQQCGDHDEDVRRRHAYQDLAAELSITPEV